MSNSSIEQGGLQYCSVLGSGADRWQNGADVTVDYNTADPLTRWDSYQNICDGEGTVATAASLNTWLSTWW